MTYLRLHHPPNEDSGPQSPWRRMHTVGGINNYGEEAYHIARITVMRVSLIASTQSCE